MRNTANKADPVKTYAELVTTGKVVAGPYVRQACQRHLTDLKTAKAQGLEWRAERALDAINFFPDLLRLENGKPFVLQPFQQFIVGSVFGWYTEAGNRRFRTAYVEIAKGSGKSPLAAGIGLYGLVADGEPSPEIYSAAVNQDQAKIVFRDAKRMVEASPELNDLIHSQVSDLTIAADYATFRPVSSEHRGLDGKRVHIALIDELHEHPVPQVVQKMRAGTKNRDNALIFEITNSGYDRTSVCWDHHQKSVGVLNGTLDDPGWFAYVCALDPKDSWLDEAVWPKVNPGIGTIQKLQYLRERVREAVTMPSSENEVKRFNFCLWTEQKQLWIDLGLWDACNAEPKIDAEKPMYMGLDAASTKDLTACVKLYGPDRDGIFDIVPMFWVPEQSLTVKGGRTEEERIVLRHWADAGFVRVTDGDVTDYDVVEDDIEAEAQKYNFIELGHDPWGLSQMVTHLQGRLGDKLLKVPPSYSGMSGPSKELERLIVGKKLRHGGNPVLRYMVANVTIIHGKEGDIRPLKVKDGKRIDGVPALIMALKCATAHLEAGPSVYEEHGVQRL